MKQSAVEWLESKLDDILELYPSEWDKVNEVIKQAKQMEAEQSKAITLQTESESKAIPELSDKEIQQHSLVLFHTNSHHRRTWIASCKWYRNTLREQLKQRQ